LVSVECHQWNIVKVSVVYATWDKCSVLFDVW
jgi:hypothetical protein